MSEEAYSEIVKKYADMVYRVALSYSKSVQDAEDVSQSVFLKLLTKKVNFADGEHVRRWLIRVTVNECKNIWNSFWRKNVDTVDILPETMPQTKERDRELYEEVMALPKNYRLVIYLYYYEEYSTKEIAAILHMKDATVRTRLARARNLLKMQLNSHEAGYEETSKCLQ